MAGWGWGGREVERLLLSFSKSPVNNAGNYHGRQNRRRKGDRKKETRRRRINIAAQCQTNMRRREKSSFTFCNRAREREALPFGFYCLDSIRSQSINTFLRRRPSQLSDRGGYGRKRKRKCRNCESLDPGDPAARHNLWAQPERRDWEAAPSPERPCRSYATADRGGAPVEFSRNRWCDCKLGEEPHVLNEYCENEGRWEPTGSFWTFMNSKE